MNVFCDKDIIFIKKILIIWTVCFMITVSYIKYQGGDIKNDKYPLLYMLSPIRCELLYNSYTLVTKIINADDTNEPDFYSSDF